MEVDFFGGEPLMNFEVVKQLVAYARSLEPECGKRFRFTRRGSFRVFSKGAGLAAFLAAVPSVRN